MKDWSGELSNLQLNIEKPILKMYNGRGFIGKSLNKGTVASKKMKIPSSDAWFSFCQFVVTFCDLKFLIF